MGRLIDADALIELIQSDIEKTSFFMNTAEKYDGSFEKLYGQLNALENYKCIIIDTPTAYDVEKVVAELEKYFDDEISKYFEGTEPLELHEYKEEVTKIIRKGGIE